ncbi:transposase [Cupriavidus taiwanensis]|uniref:Transposase n=1 Tax=Cupriavidus taiwanensis TaxID=164546 RepID=A0A9Q7UU09_9BURK|nr:transposase [Cupriavidus taiwanensis]
MPSWRPCRHARSTIMGRPDTITMSMRELDRCKVIQAVVEDGLMVWRAAEKLGLSRRQVERLVLRFPSADPDLLSPTAGSARGRRPGRQPRLIPAIGQLGSDFGQSHAGQIHCPRRSPYSLALHQSTGPTDENTCSSCLGCGKAADHRRRRPRRPARRRSAGGGEGHRHLPHRLLHPVRRRPGRHFPGDPGP